MKALMKHKIRDHHSCVFCDKGFEKLSQLSMYKYYYHSDMEFKCGSCCKTFSKMASLKEHQLKKCGKGNGTEAELVSFIMNK